MKRQLENTAELIMHRYGSLSHLYGKHTKLEDYHVLIEIFGMALASMNTLDHTDLSNHKLQDAYHTIINKMHKLKHTIETIQQGKINIRNLTQRNIATVYYTNVQDILSSAGNKCFTEFNDRMKLLGIEDRLEYTFQVYGIPLPEKNSVLNLDIQSSLAPDSPRASNIDQSFSNHSIDDSTSTPSQYQTTQQREERHSKRPRIQSTGSHKSERNQYFEQNNFFVFETKELHDQVVTLYCSPLKWVEKMLEVISNGQFTIKEAIYEQQDFDNRALYVVEGMSPQGLDLPCLDRLIREQIKHITDNLQCSLPSDRAFVTKLISQLTMLDKKVTATNMAQKLPAMIAYPLFELTPILSQLKRLESITEPTISILDRNLEERALSLHNNKQFGNWLLLWSEVLISGQYEVDTRGITGILINTGHSVGRLDLSDPSNLSLEYLIKAAINTESCEIQLNTAHLERRISQIYQNLNTSQVIAPEVRKVYEIIKNFVTKMENRYTVAQTNQPRTSPKKRVHCNKKTSQTAISHNNPEIHAAEALMQIFSSSLDMNAQLSPNTVTASNDKSYSNIATQVSQTMRHSTTQYEPVNTAQSQSTQTEKEIVRPIAKKDAGTQVDPVHSIYMTPSSITPPTDQDTNSSDEENRSDNEVIWIGTIRHS